MRENRPSGSEGGGAGVTTGASYPYHGVQEADALATPDELFLDGKGPFAVDAAPTIAYVVSIGSCA